MDEWGRFVCLGDLRSTGGAPLIVLGGGLEAAIFLHFLNPVAGIFPDRPVMYNWKEIKHK